LLDEAGKDETDEAGRPAVTFGDRLRLAEVATQFEVRRSKIEDDDDTGEIGSIMEEFHGAHVSHKTPGRARRKTREESNGVANAGIALPEFAPGRVSGAAHGASPASVHDSDPEG
jgi:hypothetical protein